MQYDRKEELGKEVPCAIFPTCCCQRVFSFSRGLHCVWSFPEPSLAKCPELDGYLIVA